MPSAGLRAGILALAAAATCLRLPGVFWPGRLWAEEGLFYQNAWTMPAGKALLVAYGGYLNLIANFGAVVARYTVPLAQAPFVLTGIGLVLQLCPALLIVTSRAGWLRSPLAMAAAALFPAIVALADEVFLQTLHSQYHLTLCAALVLSFEDAPRVAVRWVRRGLVLLAPLCGLTAIMLAPLFVARAVVDRRRERMVQAGLLLAGCAVQMGWFFDPAGGAALGRSGVVWPGLIVHAVALRQIVTPLVGLEMGSWAADGVRRAVMAGSTPLWTSVVFAIGLGAIGWACLRRFRSGAPWLFAAAIGLAAGSYYGAIGGGVPMLQPDFGVRYSFLPSVLLFWTLVCLGSTVPAGLIGRAGQVAAGWLFVVSAAASLRPGPGQTGSGPDWGQEVRAWEADPAHRILLWPRGWSMTLDPSHRPTPPAGPAL